MHLSVIGVGLVAGACLAEMGNHALCGDNDQSKIDSLNRVIPPFFKASL